ncbi:MAG: hypothetical protein WA667_17595 [Candidatus Nitrosopolaris sp.]
MYKNTSVIMASAVAAVLTIAVLAVGVPNNAFATTTISHNQVAVGGNGGTGGAGGAGGTGGAGGVNVNAHAGGSHQSANGGDANGGDGGNANGGAAVNVNANHNHF